MEPTSRTYCIVYDDDLDMWSVVTAPFNGIHFRGTRPLCERFVADESGRPRRRAISNQLAKSYQIYIPRVRVSALRLIFRATRQASA